jgi:hypothetical protein
MAIFQAVASFVGVKSSTVRSWVDMRRYVGDDLLDEFPQYRLTHWRIFRTYAKANGASLSQLALEWAETDDGYAGKPISVDTLAAKLGKPKDDRPEFVKALERAENALTVALKHAPPGKAAAVKAAIASVQEMGR